MSSMGRLTCYIWYTMSLKIYNALILSLTIPDIFDIFVSTCLICCFKNSSLSIINPKNRVLLTCSTVSLLISISKLLGFFLFLVLKNNNNCHATKK